ncbi:NIPSNAP family protein [Xanthobacter autotrophicus]|uniref:NIPSNAP family protein n=1 Tax=Xanthobacter autotrophicus TaxID=280 RepID=UPI00372A632F
MTGYRIADLRIYTIKPRGLGEFIEIFDTLAMPVQLRHLGPPIAFFASDIGPQNQVVHLWGYDSLADYDRRRIARDADPDWPAYLSASGHLLVAQENRFIKKIDLASVTRFLGSEGAAQ